MHQQGLVSLAIQLVTKAFVAVPLEHPPSPMNSMTHGTINSVKGELGNVTPSAVNPIEGDCVQFLVVACRDVTIRRELQLCPNLTALSLLHALAPRLRSLHNVQGDVAGPLTEIEVTVGLFLAIYAPFSAVFLPPGPILAATIANAHELESPSASRSLSCTQESQLRSSPLQHTSALQIADDLEPCIDFAQAVVSQLGEVLCNPHISAGVMSGCCRVIRRLARSFNVIQVGSKVE